LKRARSNQLVPTSWGGKGAAAATPLKRTTIWGYIESGGDLPDGGRGDALLTSAGEKRARSMVAGRSGQNGKPGAPP
jgi:hypothetical protein